MQQYHLIKRIRNHRHYPNFGTDIWQNGKYVLKITSLSSLCRLKKRYEIYLDDVLLESFDADGTTNIKAKLAKYTL